MYDIIVQKICAKDSGRRAGMSAILHVESAANISNMGVQLQQTISDSGKALGRRLVDEADFVSGDDDELNWFSGVWMYNEEKEPESKSSVSSAASKPAIDHVIYHALPSKQCANCGKRGKGFKQCSRCKAVKYCSRKCQKEHWQAIHKSVCNPKTSVQVISGHKQHKTFKAIMEKFWRYKGAIHMLSPMHTSGTSVLMEFTQTNLVFQMETLTRGATRLANHLKKSYKTSLSTNTWKRRKSRAAWAWVMLNRVP